ncbi:MAG: zinc-binding dehydrogenase [Candidatus Acidiferrales bacterium]|jgi:NADPH:quinone reductase-like Zn-dependent oxidoreductase
MKAIIFRKHGGPSVLQYTEVPEPRLHPVDVLVRVRACAVNHLDLWVRRGMPGVPIPLPHIPGSDIAGEVARVGERVTRVKVGDKVVLAPGVSCGKCAHCLAGRDNRCHEFTNLGYMIDGGCAEFVRCPEVNCFPLPEGLSFEEVAAVPYVFQTAWHMLVARAGIQPGETVLVVAGESGVGSAAVQIARFFGARVIVTAGTEEKMARARELGADDVIHHGVYRIDEEVKRLTNRRGVDIVFEHVGAETWDQSIASLARGGRLVSCGATTGEDAKLNLAFLFRRQISVLGSYMGTKSELETILKLVAAGRLRPVIDRVLPLESCAEAHAILERREQFGKIVLTVERKAA